jgi:hypothetical protein
MMHYISWFDGNDKTKIQQTSKFSADPQNLITKKNKHIIMKTNLFHVKTQLMKIDIYAFMMHYISWFDGSYKNHKIGIKQIKVHST